MHDKHGKDGLVVLGVTLDGNKDTEAREKAQAFLEKLKVPFRNVALDVDLDKVPRTLDFGGGVPGVFVFNRDNRHVLKLPVLDAKRQEVAEPLKYEAIDKAVLEQLKKK
jgi:hypothetical protein